MSAVDELDELLPPPALTREERKPISTLVEESIDNGAVMPALRRVPSVMGIDALVETVAELLRGGLGFRHVVEQLGIMPRERRLLLARPQVTAAMRECAEVRQMLVESEFLDLAEARSIAVIEEILDDEEAGPGIRLKAVQEVNKIAGLGPNKKAGDINIAVNQTWSSERSAKFKERLAAKREDVTRRSADEWRQGGPADDE